MTMSAVVLNMILGFSSLVALQGCGSEIPDEYGEGCEEHTHTHPSTHRDYPIPCCKTRRNGGCPKAHCHMSGRTKDEEVEEWVCGVINPAVDEYVGKTMIQQSLRPIGSDPPTTTSCTLEECEEKCRNDAKCVLYNYAEKWSTKGGTEDDIEGTNMCVLIHLCPVIGLYGDLADDSDLTLYYMDRNEADTTAAPEAETTAAPS